jgi:hypothetical protein
MSQWTRAETELLINISSEEPQTALVTTNWPFYVSRLAACEAFSEDQPFVPAAGHSLVGRVDQGDYTYLHLRKQLSVPQQAEFAAQKAQLPAPTSTPINYRTGPYERETLLHAEPLNPYWMVVDTDMAHWIRRLDQHPWAVLIAEQLYVGADPDTGEAVGEEEAGEFTDRHRVYYVPRQLLSIRRKRRQLTDEQKQALRDRLGIS